MYIRLTTIKLLFVVNRASHRHTHTQCVKRRKSFTVQAYSQNERDTRETQVEPSRVAQFFGGCHYL